MLTIIILIILALLILAIIIATVKFVLMMTLPKKNSHQEARERFKRTANLDCDEFENSYEHESFSFDSSKGYTLRGIIFHAHKKDTSKTTPSNEEKEETKISVYSKNGNNKAVIIVHGYTANYIFGYTYAKMMLDLGFDAILYDHRTHGISDKYDKRGKKLCCSMGYYETQDLIELFHYMKKKYPADCKWGLLGESMGAATVMQASCDLPELSFVIEDCGYSSMKDEALAEFKSLHLPSFPVMQIGNAFIKLRWGFSLFDVDATKAMERTSVPVLFCHGDADTFVPTKMIYKVYNAKKDNKTMKLYKDSIHARSLIDHPEEYANNVKEFLKKYNVIS